jgi:hypothetical protein
MSVAESCGISPVFIQRRIRTPQEATDDIADTISQRPVVWPLPADVKAKFAAGCDDVKNIPKKLFPEVSESDRCKCDLPYERSVLIGKPTVFCPLGARTGVELYATDCPNRRRECRKHCTGNDCCYWICNKQTVISEGVFMNTLESVNSVCFIFNNCSSNGSKALP